MDAIGERIDSTVANLEEKKTVLLKHKSQYNDLKFRLMDFAQYKETDQPKVDVRMNSKAIVKGHIINPQKVLVFLGCEYFVERDPTKSIELVEHKLKFLNKAISEFDSKIKEAKKTIENIGHLEEYEKNQTEKKEEIPKPQSSNLSSEDLPFMDIREELDEDGNVINSTVQKQDENRIKEFGEKHGIKMEDDSDDQINEMLKDMEITPRSKIEELPEEVITEESSKSKEIETEDIKEPIVSKVEESKTDTPSKEQDDYFDLLKQLGISTAGDPNKQQESRKPNEEPKDVNENDSTPQNEESKDIPSENDWESFKTEGPAIAEDDILQLQLIADEIEEEGDYDYDDDEFDHDFEQDQDDDEEEEDWDFSSNPENLVPESHRNLFMKELNRVRAEKTKSELPVDTKDEPIKEPSKPRKKKSVSFAPELQIKEIENVSEELKTAPDISRVSKFKQMRISNTQSQIQDDDEVQEGEVIEAAVSDLIVEKDLPEPVIQRSISETVISDIKEKEEEEIPEPPKPKVSRFKQRSTKSMEQPQMNIPINESITENIIGNGTTMNDIVEREPDQTIVEAVSKSQTQEPEPKTTKAKVSRFKSSKEQSKGNVISIPESEPQYIPEENEYNNIKAYIANDSDDEDELNELTDLEVYTASDFDEDGQFIEEADDDEDDEDDRNVLTDEIVEHDEVDDPSYYVDENLLQREYQDLRRKMIEKYVKSENANNGDKIITKEEKESELEPIDESGNPVKVSRFRQSMSK